MRYTHFTTMDSRLAILPTARKVEEELKRLSREGCVMGHRLMTFPQLVDALWNEVGSPLRLIDPISEQVAIGEAIQRRVGRERYRDELRAESDSAGCLLRTRDPAVEERGFNACRFAGGRGRHTVGLPASRRRDGRSGLRSL